jgi:hypothetical protein
MNQMNRRTVYAALAAVAMGAGVRRAGAQEVTALSAEALAKLLSDDTQFGLFTIDLDIIRSSLLRVLFVRLKATSVPGLSQYTVSKDYFAERAEYFRVAASTFDPQARASIVNLLKSDPGAAQFSDAAGKAAVGPAQRMANALSESGLFVPRSTRELVQSFVVFSQATAVLQKSASTPIPCRYFPFSYFCSAA